MSNYFLNDSFNFIAIYSANQQSNGSGNDTTLSSSAAALVNSFININSVINGVGGNDSSSKSYFSSAVIVDDNFTITGLPNSTTTTTDLLPLTNDFNGKISLSTVIPLTIVYLVIFISGVLGNVITCIVISKNKSMHTATNYYLFSLAISDLLVLIAGKFNLT